MEIVDFEESTIVRLRPVTIESVHRGAGVTSVRSTTILTMQGIGLPGNRSDFLFCSLDRQEVSIITILNLTFKTPRFF